MSSLDQRILARAHNDIVTTRDLHGVGYSSREIEKLVRSNSLHRIRRGYYSTRQPTDPSDRHGLATAALLRSRPTLVATGVSALLLHGLPVVGGETGPVHLLAPRPAERFTAEGVCVWISDPRSAPAVDSPGDPSGDLRRVDVATAVVHAGCRSGEWAALAAADAAIRHGLTSREQIEFVAQERRRGMGRVRGILPLIDGRRESPGESGAALLLHDLGYETEPQVWIGPYRVDLLIKGTRVIVEFDGAVKYDNRAVLVGEKRREDDLRARGYTLVRLMWPDLSQPKKVHRLVTSALAQTAA